MKDKTLDVVALGELLIDFTQNGLSEQGNPLFEANPGGAPCNVLAMLRKLGKRCAFVGKVGRDGFGRQLARVAEEAGINLQGLRYDPSRRRRASTCRACGMIPTYTPPWPSCRPCPGATGISAFTASRGRTPT